MAGNCSLTSLGSPLVGIQGELRFRSSGICVVDLAALSEGVYAGGSQLIPSGYTKETSFIRGVAGSVFVNIAMKQAVIVFGPFKMNYRRHCAPMARPKRMRTGPFFAVAATMT
jgi:hypothetical protein